MISQENTNYELKYTANGLPNFYKDGERVKGKDLPKGMRERLLETVDQKPEDADDENKKITSDKICIFCQEPADSGKVLNQSFIALCRDHYLTKNLGKVAQRIRELNETNLQKVN